MNGTINTECGVRIVYANHLAAVNPSVLSGLEGRRRGLVLGTSEEDWSLKPEETLKKYRETD